MCKQANLKTSTILQQGAACEVPPIRSSVGVNDDGDEDDDDGDDTVPVFQARVGERRSSDQRPLLPSHASGPRRHASHLPDLVR